MAQYRAIFLNSPQAQCSIHESGKMIFSAIADSSQFDWVYADLHEKYQPDATAYDCVLFNYHPGTMPWLDMQAVRGIECLKGTIILETLPDSCFRMCPPDLFDFHLAIDPTVSEIPGRVYGLPRPLHSIATQTLADPAEMAEPTIGTFGFATPGKGFERVVDAVNREFDRATIRVHIPQADFADKEMHRMHNMPYVEYLLQLMRKVAKAGVTIEATHAYRSQAEIVAWCGQNTINVFLYDRIQPGLSATTDQAIASGRPLLVSDNQTFRHIHTYMPAYPDWTLRQAIALGGQAVRKIQEAWNPDAFRKHLERAVLESMQVHHTSLRPPSVISFPQKPQPSKLVRNIVRVTNKIRAMIQKRLSRASHSQQPPAPDTIETPLHGSGLDVLFVNHSAAQCGVHQYGLNIATQLRTIAGVRLHYKTASSANDFFEAYKSLRPAAVIVNHFHATMPWFTPEVAREIAVPRLGFLHEMTPDAVESLDNSLFDVHLVSDPTNRSSRPDVFHSPRLLPDFCNYDAEPTVPTFGSFGFGIANKGFEECIDRIQAEYDEARIIFQMPFNDVIDRSGACHAQATAERCRKRVLKPGITLEIHHSFLKTRALLKFLGSNTANIFLYDESLHRGLSSVLEFAVAARRPLIINRCQMFRHVSSLVPGISLHDRTIREIVAEGIAPLVPLYNEWSAAMFRKRWREFLLHDLPNRYVIRNKGQSNDRLEKVCTVV
jgi:hypothetical protein